MAFKPGLGVGGHCIPVDPMYLAWFAKKVNSDSSLIELAARINLNRTHDIAELIRVTQQENKRVLIVGIGYKQGTKDTRESPSLELIKILRNQGYSVTWHDPYVGIWDGEKSEATLNADLIVYVHPYLSKSELEEFSGAIIDLTGTLKNQENIISL
jgi:UDP-N-acetyl-D-glucosamine dehydrogenase